MQDDSSVERVIGRHKISDACEWQVYGDAAAETLRIQAEFDKLIETDEAFRNIIAALTRNSVKAVVIGGWVRDQFLRRTQPLLRSRDVDLVAECQTCEQLEKILPPAIRRTVFGGLTFSGSTVDVDLWPLGETYLFRRFGLAPTFTNVLAVTDFTINAILFYPRQFWAIPKIEDGGCFASMTNGEIDFHFEWVPIPTIQVARLVHFAAKTQFALSTEVRKFIRKMYANASVRDAVFRNLDQFCPSEYRENAKALLTSVGATAKTRYFSNCLGVFEGGGVRAAAFAGAYSAAYEAGVTFTKVSGTSAGSIAACFVATGAKPDDVKRCLFEADLAQLANRLDRSKRLGHGTRIFKRFLHTVSCGRLKKVLTLDLFAGLYTSEGLTDWVDQTLHSLLLSRGYDVGSRLVTFADLPIPLYVIASDLTRNRPQVWSRDQTPDASVAFAVRCSCTIPFFYQPVRVEDSSAYVDGGILSNTPAFVFREEHGNDRSQYSARILAFRLIQNNKTRRDLFDSIDAFIHAVGNTVVDGGSQLQRDLQSGIYTVGIDTGNIGSTDFAKIGSKEKVFLFEQGRTAVDQFVRTERDKLYGLQTPMSYVGRDQKMLLLVNALKDCEREIILVDHNSHWLYLIFPAFLAAARRGVRIQYITTSDAASNRDEQYRQKLLEGLGAAITRTEQIPFTGLISDPDSASAQAAVTQPAHHTEAFDHERTRLYSMQADASIVVKLFSELKPHLTYGPTPAVEAPLTYAPCAESKLFGRLRSVPQYANARFSMEEVSLDETLHGLQTHIKEFKYLQIDWLTHDFVAKGINLFQPQEVLLIGGARTIVTPPVVEICGDRKVIIEGHTRAFHCLRSGMPSFVAVVVDNVEAALPTRVQRFKDIAFASRTVTLHAQFQELSRGLWREVEAYVHPATDDAGD